MNIYKKSDDFKEDENRQKLSKKVSKEIQKQLRVFDSEFAAADDNSVIVLDKGECLTDLFEDFPHLEKIRPENSVSIDNYINQVYVTSDNGAGTSVYLPVDQPQSCGDDAFMEYRAKYLYGGGPRV